jgi:hypothetical protein
MNQENPKSRVQVGQEFITKSEVAILRGFREPLLDEIIVEKSFCGRQEGYCKQSFIK